MNRRKAHKSKSRTSALLAALLAAAIAGGLLFIHFFEQHDARREAEAIAARSRDVVQQDLTLYHGGRWYRLRPGVESYLILGVDKNADYAALYEEGDLLNNLQADFLLLMVVDREDKSFTGLHLNRDTLCEIQRLGHSGQRTGLVTQQLCLSHTYGSGGKESCRNSAQAVSRLLYDVPVDHYYAVTMDAIPVLNDLVGGVPVHIDDDLTAADPAFTPGSDVTLHGEQALRFVRARMSVTDGTNLSRMNRQRTYMTALYERLMAKLRASDRFALSLATTLEGYSTSDLITDELADLATRLKDYRFAGVESTPGTADASGQHIEFHPDEAALQETVLRLFCEPEA